MCFWLLCFHWSSFMCCFWPALAPPQAKCWGFFSRHHSIMLTQRGLQACLRSPKIAKDLYIWQSRFWRKITPFCLCVVFMWLQCKYGNVWHPLVTHNVRRNCHKKSAFPLYSCIFRIFSLQGKCKFESRRGFFSCIPQSCLGRKYNVKILYFLSNKLQEKIETWIS